MIGAYQSFTLHFGRWHTYKCSIWYFIVNIDIKTLSSRQTFSKDTSKKYFSIILVLLIVGNLEYNYSGNSVECLLLPMTKCTIKPKHLVKQISQIKQLNTAHLLIFNLKLWTIKETTQECKTTTKLDEFFCIVSSMW